ncbi:MAG: efflux RND transporter permease subunit [Deltaproteobacteria bacterium]|jgi:multidrug efflux pump|nr:efflux RND transporter permease subunit [Deltaproteobacteria bacterium]
MSHFFIDRPIFAWVIAMLMMLGGALIIPVSPVNQYPDIAPPEISITSSFPGASAQTVENSVTQIIEQQMKGLDYFNYMYSTSDSAGRSNIVVSFTQEANPDIAQVQVQNKLQLAMSMLPEEVQRQGIVINKSTANFFLVLAFISQDGSMTQSDLADYMNSYLIDPLSRVPGVGDTQLFGMQYGMRIWLDPDLLSKYKMNVTEVIAAIRAQNIDAPAGEIGGGPPVAGQRVNFTVIAQSKFRTPEQFAGILLRTNPDGSTVKIKDIARVELETERFMAQVNYNGKPSAGIGIKLATGANAMDVANRIQERIDELSRFFPAGMETVVSYDTTPFIRVSLLEVVKTLVEAVILVFLLMYLFLQNLRATIIPTITIPVVLLGTFAVMGIAGFSINILTMFGMVLAIGLLVDDAIVVVENVERVMDEERLSPRDAARKSMTQITGALVGIGLVLSAVFVPMAFFGGSTGVIYRQFSITVVTAMALSVLIAIVLTPALCATMMRHSSRPAAHVRRSSGFFGWFNRAFNAFVRRYTGSVALMLKHPLIMMLVYCVLIAGLAFFLLRLPTSFLPEEDQGILLYQVQLPDGASFERTGEVMEKIREYYEKNESDTVSAITSIAGFSFNGMGQNMGVGFIRLKPWEERTEARQRAPAVAARAMRNLLYTGDGMVYTLVPPAIPSMGISSGFDIEIMDNAGIGHAALAEMRDKLLYAANTRPDIVSKLMAVRQNGMGENTQYRLEIDIEKASAQGLDINTITSTISSLWGGYYVNNFIERGRAKRVFIQLEPHFRAQAEDFSRIRIRNSKGDMVPLSSMARGEWIRESPRLERFNGVPALEFLGQATPGHSSGEAMQTIEELAREIMPLGMGTAWKALSFQEKLSGDQAPMLYTVSMIVVFLCLAALYESWSIPISVMLVIPLGIIGAVGGAYLRGLTNDVYFQVGLLTIIGLSAKNAILIVEFAKTMEEEGKDIIEATVAACRLRIRPIIMTSMAFILGVLPLAMSTGAGSGAQNAIGTGVLSGMISATLLGIFYIPVFFVLVSKIFKVKIKTTAHASVS